MSNRLYEPGAFDILEEWFGKRPVFPVGPVEDPWNELEMASENGNSTNATEVETFLDVTLEKFGQNSVVYVGGTILSPVIYP